jgi:hypothetical protein
MRTEKLKVAQTVLKAAAILALGLTVQVVWWGGMIYLVVLFLRCLGVPI